MSNLMSQVFRFMLKLVFALSAAVLAAGVLLFALIAVAVGLLIALATGRKFAPAMAFSRFQQFSRPGPRPAGGVRRPSPKSASGQVVDVEVREIAVGQPHS